MQQLTTGPRAGAQPGRRRVDGGGHPRARLTVTSRCGHLSPHLLPHLPPRGTASGNDKSHMGMARRDLRRRQADVEHRTALVLARGSPIIINR